jgi:hypothetical protein
LDNTLVYQMGEEAVFRVGVCLEIRGKAARPTTPVASVVTSKLDRHLVACTRKVPP